MNRIFLVVFIAWFLVGCSRSQPTQERTSAPRTTSTAVTVDREGEQSQEEEKHAVVHLTNAAADKVHALQEKAGGAYLRVFINGSATTGFTYDMKFDEKRDPKNDFYSDENGIKTIVDRRSSLFLEGATIDWETTSDGRQGFRFDNPNAEKH